MARKNKGKLKKKIKAAVHNVGVKIKTGVRNTAAHAKYLPLAPFLPAMLIILHARGIKPKSNHLYDVAPAFAANILTNSKFEREQFEADHLVEETVDMVIAIVKKIVNYFKQKKAAKDAGEKLPAEEEAALNQSEQDIKNMPDNVLNALATGDVEEDKDSNTASEKSDYSIFGIIITVAIIYIVVMKLMED